MAKAVVMRTDQGVMLLGTTQTISGAKLYWILKKEN